MARTTIEIFTPKFEAERVRLELCAAADRHKLEVERLTGRRGPLGYRLNVTVAGAPEQIEAFHREFQGDGWPGNGGTDLAEFVLNPLLTGLLGAGQRSIASRLRRRKLERQDPDRGPGASAQSG